jgi:hypothetical protein
MAKYKVVKEFTIPAVKPVVEQAEQTFAIGSEVEMDDQTAKTYLDEGSIELVPADEGAGE